MNTATLYNKDDQTTYAILHAMLQANSLSITTAALADDYRLTNYQINKYFAAINADLQTVSTDKPLYLDETLRGTWHANNLTTYGLQRLGLLYLQRSSAFLVFEYRFLYSARLSKREYIDSQAISTPSFYSVSQALDKTLKAAGFFTASGTFEDPEYTLRLHLFELYYTAYTGVSTPFASMDVTVSGLLERCATFIGKPLRPTQATKLSVFVKLWLLRVQNGGTLAAPLIATDALDASAKAFLAAIQDYMAPIQVLSDSECNYLYTFMVAQGFVSFGAHRQLEATFPEATRLTSEFIDNLTAHAKLVDRSLLALDKLVAGLDQIHLQYTSFFVEPTTFIDPAQVTFFQDLYPGFDAVIAGFITKLQRGAKQLSQNVAVNLYFSYMFALIAAIPPRALNDLVYVCVDFSQGTLYSDYVIQTLAAFSHAHIVIEPNVSADTDIYIADFHADTLQQPQVIWQNPPTPNDWSNLADMILAIKQAKTAALLH